MRASCPVAFLLLLAPAAVLAKSPVGQDDSCGTTTPYGGVASAMAIIGAVIGLPVGVVFASWVHIEVERRLTLREDRTEDAVDGTQKTFLDPCPGDLRCIAGRDGAHGRCQLLCQSNQQCPEDQRCVKDGKHRVCRPIIDQLAPRYRPQGSARAEAEAEAARRAKAARELLEAARNRAKLTPPLP